MTQLWSSLENPFSATPHSVREAPSISKSSVKEHLGSATTLSLQAVILFAEQLLRENSFCESCAAISERPLLKNIFLNAPLFQARTLSPFKGVLFVEHLLQENNFCDTRTTVFGEPLLQNSFSVCSSRMRSRQCLD